MLGVARAVCRTSRQCNRQILGALSPSPAATAVAVLPQMLQPRSSSCHLHTTPGGWQNNSQRNYYKVLYIPNPFKWLHNRMELASLKREWDPSFDIDSFLYGATQALCTVTEHMNRRDWGELCGLLTQKVINKLRNTKLTTDQFNNLTLLPDNVQVSTVNKVILQTIVDHKYCDIDVLFLATRLPYNAEKHSLIVLEYIVRFHREYTDGKLPEWTITKFKLKRFQAIPKTE